MNSGEYIYCYKEPDGYYLDNSLYKECFKTCKKCALEGNYLFHNCSQCNDDFSFGIKNYNNYFNCYENCGYHFFNDYEKNLFCNFNSSCDILPYSKQNEFECNELDFEEIIDNILNNERNKTNKTKEEEYEFYNKIFQRIEKRFTSENYDTFDLDNGKDTLIKAEQLIITFTTTKNQKYNKYNNMTTLDLGDCETLLRNFYHIPENKPLYIKKIDKIQDGMKTLKVEYDVYAKLSGKNLINLNLTICEKSKLSIFIPIILNGNLDKYNPNSRYYNDICYTTISEDGTDIIMKDRQNEFIEKDRIVCQEDCYFSDYNYDTSKARCICQVKECPQLFDGMNINKAKILENFKNFYNYINFKFLVSYNKLFNKKGFINNIGCYLILSIIFFHIFTILIFKIKSFYSIETKIKKIAIEKHKYLYDKRNYRRQIKNKQKIHRLNSNRIFILGKRIINKNKIYNKNIVNESEFKINLKKIKDKSNKENINKYIDEEINGFSYNLSLKIDKRTYCQYYISLLKTQHILICALFNNNDYNSVIIKFNLFLIGFTIEYIVNALFYNDDTMHKIYETKGEFDLENQIPIIVYSTIISSLLNYPLNFLALSNEPIINFKQGISKINIKKSAKKLKNILS